MDIAVWVLVVVAGVIALFLVRLLNQFTSATTEFELVLRNLNSQLPQILKKADRVMDNAEKTIVRVNTAMNDFEGPLRIVKTVSGFFGDSKQLMSSKGGQGAIAFAAGYKLVKMIVDKIKGHARRRHEKSPEE